MIIATAGHIDHGKTTLLEALTGQGGDQRREEKERGITIDLGYRYANLGGEATLGFIDVPGHERFIHNMLAGAGGVDLALLVVAADDGVMPQTREHLAILELLGIPQLWIALTKCDRVERQTQQSAAAEIESLLASGPYAGAPIFPLSSSTGQGVPELRHALLNEARNITHQADKNYFRLSIDRAFSVSGAGTVVTGTALAGRIQTDDSLLLCHPNGGQQQVRVRGIHAQNKASASAQTGQRVALNLAGERLKAEQIQRGSWIVASELLNPSRRLDIQLNLLADAPRPLEHWTPVHIHIGAQRLTGRIALLEASHIAPGACGLAQLVLDGYTHAVHGDRVILRDQSAWHTLGGGIVLDPNAPTRQRRTAERLAQLKALTLGSLEAALPSLLATAKNGLAPDALERQFNRPQHDWQLPDKTIIQPTSNGPRLFTQAIWQDNHAALLDTLTRFHQELPDEPGPDRGRLRRFGLPHIEPAVFGALIDAALAQGNIAATGPWLHLPEFSVRLSTEEESLKAKLWPHLESGGINPPWVRDLARLENCEETQVRHLLLKLARLGQLHQVVRDLFYPEIAIEQLITVILKITEQNDTLEVIEFRDAVGLGRKRCIQLLEYLDRLGVTRRFGNHRRLRTESSLVLRVKNR
ncbi:selenocysteine-specific translation elongation factor [Denitrificimonas sp. JX-1]|uniref:Selenocysteine-specific elongation factor n=1 Tax=Denitrificimonas halotolerans TaxID=3098930 RepID=A0ABU5GR28_9GAMM|nr:selenocysteine-specific translation elongation factor [Denitrificimonas sp. JX-1]MDY7219244.1 selenocysteine-specific translation elongation factor [Denitrificimonas sp. JX-1]